MQRVLIVFVGSGFGGAMRYLFALWAGRSFGTAFPYGTLGVNALGSFLIALIMHLGLRGIVGPELRLALTTGVMGGFTTYSTFNYETLSLWQQGAWGVGLLNLGMTVAVCLAMGMLGFAAGRLVAG